MSAGDVRDASLLRAPLKSMPSASTEICCRSQNGGSCNYVYTCPAPMLGTVRVPYMLGRFPFKPSHKRGTVVNGGSAQAIR